MTPQTITHEEETRSSAEIQSEIRETRERMDATLDQLGNRLSARSIFTSALDWWDSGNQGSTAARSALTTVYRQAKQHPMPALLIGSGLAWLVSESMGGDDEDTASITRYRRGREPGDAYEIEPESGAVQGVKTRIGRRRAGARGIASDASLTAGEKASMLSGKASELGHKAGDKASQFTHAVSDKASELTSKVGDKMQQASEEFSQQAHEVLDRGKSAARKIKEDVKSGYQTSSEKFEQACEEHPLAVGVAFVALGALAGLALPRTRREDELMGDQSDHLVEETKEKAEHLLESGKVVGTRVLEAVKQEAQEQGISGASVSEKISDLANRSGEVLRKAKDEAARAAEEEGLKSSTDSEPSGSSRKIDI